jgi:NitT/TauT family transport system ATP-binding protein
MMQKGQITHWGRFQMEYYITKRDRLPIRKRPQWNTQCIKGRCNMKEVLKVKNVSKKYQAKNGEVEALKNISFTINEGEFVSLIGPSGCGKSTMLSIIAGLEDKNSGEIEIDGEIGYMLQKDSLLEWLTIYKNVMFGLEIRHLKTTENVQYVDNLLKKYNLYEFKDKYPNQLSGGMRQRAALIRTLAIKPKILLLDEAFSALDYQTRIMVTKDIYDILRKENITALIVTHDISEAISMSDRVIVLSNRPATVKEIHTIDFEMENRTPLNCRESPKFSKYFDIIWKGLDVHEG